MTIDRTIPLAPPDDRLEAELAAMSQWQGDAPGLWKRAIEAEPAHGGSRQRILSRRVGGPLLLLILLPLIVVPILLPALGKARAPLANIDSQYASPRGDIMDRRGGLAARDDDRRSSAADPVAGYLADAISADRFSSSAAPSAAVSMNPQTESMKAMPEVRDSTRAADTPARLVARKASIDLAVRDVRAAFAKAAFLVSEAGGEFVEDSSLTGEGERAQANLTLRIRADRLGAVLGQLRDLGIVIQESTRGEDVTDQAVDLDARIRNEQRVEKELAELLLTRKDSPLRDIMEVRDALGRVRENIERLTAQRDRLSRMVSLSTILVVIRHESAVKLPEAPRPDGLGAYFAKTIASAWRTATRALADTVAFIVTVLVGGALWWIAVIIAVVAALRWRARALAAKAYEPAPAWAGSGGSTTSASTSGAASAAPIAAASAAPSSGPAK